ncbi:MAG: hypothetical protein CSA07_00635 [Bacteroidia bacterium]|nr:MAG: hypothetical protein CSA07_00635 [Bacteroidia bacterium]
MVRRVNLPGGWQATGLPYRLGGEEAPLPGALGLDSLSLAEIYIYGHDTCRLLPSPGGPHLSLRWAYDEHSNELTLSRMDDDGAEAELYATLRIIPQDTLLYVGVGTDPASGKTLYKPFRRVYWFY